MKHYEQLPAWMDQKTELTEEELDKVAGGAGVAQYAWAAIVAGATMLKNSKVPLGGPIRRPRR